jgi:diamine N-acetyltransferase
MPPQEIINIQKLTLADVNVLQSISEQTFVDAFGADNTEADMQIYIHKYLSTKKLQSELENEHSQFYLALQHEKPVGYLKVNFAAAQTDLHENHSLEVERIYVLTEMFGKNVGALLMDKAYAIAQENQLTSIWLGVWEKNARAIRFYEKQGFVKFTTHKFMLGTDEQTDWLMRKELKANVIM